MYRLIRLLCVSVVIGFLVSAAAQDTAFTYQGRLNSGETPATGIYDLKFSLYDAASGGTQLGETLYNFGTSVSNGLFVVTLNFGNEFPGADRWLEVGVANSGGSMTTLTPRQHITSTPYAVRAVNVSGSVAASQLTGQILSNNIGAGSITTVMLAAGAVGSNQLAAGAVTTAALADSAVTASKVATVSNWSSLSIANPSPAFSDLFGTPVAAVGSNQFLIGAQFDNTGASDAGAAYLFSTSGTLLTTFTDPTPANSDYFGASVAGVGTDRALIGARNGDVGAVNAGTAYLFSLSGALVTTFTNPTPAANDSFGYTLAAFGSDRVLVGAIGDDAGATDSGTAYLFGTNGALLATFNNPTPGASDFFGLSLAMIGSDRVLVGAIGDDSGATDAGAAYLFNTNGTLVRTFLNPAPTTNEWFGMAVAGLGIDRVLIGAPYDDTGATDAGVAYLFNTNGTLLMTFTNPAPTVADHFGVPVAVLGNDQVLISASGNDAAGLDSGVVYLFSTNGALLKTFVNPAPATGDGFGGSLAVVGGEKVLVGASGDDLEVTDAGTAYLFSPGYYTPGLVSDGVRADSITTTSLRDGAVSASKIGGVLYATQIPNIDAGTITSGLLADTRLSANIARLDSFSEDPLAQAQTFTGENRFNHASNSFTGTFIGNGSGLTSLNASNLTGVLNAGQIPSLSLNASNITSGTMSDARLSSNIPLLNGTQVFTAQNTFNSLIVSTTARVNGNNNWGVSGGEGDFRVGNDTYRFKIGVANAGGGAGDVWMRAHGGIERINIKAPGGTRILSNEGETLGVSLAAGGTAWATISDRNAKKDFAAVDGVEILEKLAAMPITQWHYKWEEAGTTPHIGPMAQDFKAAFYPGTDDKSITTQEADGVALAAIQGLNQKLEETRVENAKLKERLQQLEEIVSKLSQQ